MAEKLALGANDEAMTGKRHSVWPANDVHVNVTVSFGGLLHELFDVASISYRDDHHLDVVF